MTSGKPTKLGKRELDALTCPPGQRYAKIFDKDLKGFGVRVAADGAKVFVFEYRCDKVLHRMVLGPYGDPMHGKLTLAQGRKRAEVLRGAVRDGRNPQAEHEAERAAEAAKREEGKRQAATDAFTLEALVQAWADEGLSHASSKHRREAPQAVRNCFGSKKGTTKPDYLSRPAASLTADDVRQALAYVATTDNHRTAARKARDYLRAAYNWAAENRGIVHNPAAVKISEKPRSRDRALTDAELGAVWRATGSLDYPFGPLLRLLILTLQRRGEVAGMEWRELDADLATWSLPASRAKNNKAHIVHLAEPARAILRELAKRDRKPGQVLVFTTTGRTAVSGFSRAVHQVRKAIDAEAPPAGGPIEWRGRWTVHDLRRTGVTTLARLGVPPHVADKMLNHVQGTIRGVAAVYQRHEFLAEREAAARRWADHVLAVAEAGAPTRPALPANVVRLPGGRRR